MLPVLLSLIVSAAVAWMLIRRVASTSSAPPGGIHFHATKVPRIGGIAVLSGLLIGTATILVQLETNELRSVALAMFISTTLGATPSLSSRLAREGHFWKVAPTVVSLATPLLVYSSFFSIELPFSMLLHGYLTLAGFTLFTLLSIRMTEEIDTFNGLCGAFFIALFGAVALLGNEVNDTLVRNLALAGLGSTLGFFLWNYPGGFIFIGPTGTVALSVYSSQLIFLLIFRNPGQTSGALPFLIFAYPAYEFLSRLTRALTRGLPIWHGRSGSVLMLLWRRNLRAQSTAIGITKRQLAQAMLLPYFLALAAPPIVAAYYTSDSTLGIMLCLLASLVVFAAIQQKLIYSRVSKERINENTKSQSRTQFSTSVAASLLALQTYLVVAPTAAHATGNLYREIPVAELSVFSPNNADEREASPNSRGDYARSVDAAKQRGLDLQNEVLKSNEFIGRERLIEMLSQVSSSAPEGAHEIAVGKLTFTRTLGNNVTEYVCPTWLANESTLKLTEAAIKELGDIDKWAIWHFFHTSHPVLFGLSPTDVIGEYQSLDPTINEMLDRYEGGLMGRLRDAARDFVGAVLL